MTQPTWTPVNDVEAALADALARGDSQAYFQALAEATLYLPAVEEPGPQQLVTVRSGDDVYLIVFTSCEALAERLVGVTAFRTTTCDELLANWPNQDWMLAVDPDTPIQAYAPIDVITDASAGRIVLPSTLEPRTEPANDLEADLDRAIRSGDVDAVIGVLALGTVHVPVASDGTSWASFAEQTIAVFTSIGQMAASIPAGTASDELPFLDVAMDWPGLGWHLVVNPGSTAPLVFDAVQVLGFVAWAQEFAYGMGLEPDDQLLKVIGEDQVDGYLRGHRKDVTGTVFRASDLGDVEALVDLHAASGGAVEPDNDTVYVIRFAAHCPDLYRQSDARLAWRTQASVLPHGAQLQRISRDGDAAWIATFDADLEQWVPLQAADLLRVALTT